MPLTASQEAAVNSSHEPLFIQAGAGTGKTFTLTKRIARGLSRESGPVIGAVDRLLTITFTNKAAGELIGRIRAELRDQGLDEESMQIDAAWISTIHAMCRRMLLAHAFDTGTDPGAAMLTEDETKALSYMALDELLKDKADDPALNELLDAFGVDDTTELLDDLAQVLELAPGGVADFDLGPKPPSSRNAVQRIQNILDLYKDARDNMDDLGWEKQTPVSYERVYRKTTDLIVSLEAWLAALDQDPTWDDVNTLLEESPHVAAGGLKKEYKEVFVEPKAMRDELETIAQTAVMRDRLVKAMLISQEHLERHRALKRSRGALDTNDLIMGAYRMLTEHEDVAQAYRDTFDSIMVDEFQDTDELQVGIVTTICDEGLSTLATVGDAQQSIYGFRGADLGVYRRMRAAMREHGSNEVDLTVNYRSQPDILRFVEDIFSKPEFFGGEFLKVSSGRRENSSPQWLAEGDPCVKVLISVEQHTDGNSGKVSTDDLRWADATALADEFERLHGQGASYGDMAILLRSTRATSSKAYLREFRKRGIPCVISGGSDFFTLDEVAIVSRLLRVLADRDDDEALYDLLGSDMFDASDDDLLALSVLTRQKLRLGLEDARCKPSLFDALRAYVQDDQQRASVALVRALEVLEYALAAAKSMPIAQVLRTAIELSGWRATLAQRGVEGGAVFANVEHACDWVGDYEQANGHVVFAASEYFRNLLDLAAGNEGARAKFGKLVSGGGNAVQIMTIHSSKGLEFPIVAVAEFEGSKRGKSGRLISLTENGRRHLAMKPGGDIVKKHLEGLDDLDSFSMASDAVAFRAHAHNLKERNEYEEAQRLLYVALTRARDELILVVHGGKLVSKGEMPKGLAEDCMHAVFGDELPVQNDTIRTNSGALVGITVTEASPGASELTGEEEDESLAVMHCYPAFDLPPRMSAQPARQTQIYSYSSIARHDASPSEQLALAITLRDRSQNAETASSVGSAFHLVAQWLALAPRTSETAIEHRLLAAARRYGLDEAERDRLANAVAAWVSSDCYAQTQEYAHRHAEFPFCVDVDGVALEGYIDLVCLDDQGGAFVVDYKTGTSGQGEGLHERYELQADCYAYALLSSGVCDHLDMVFARPEVGMEEVRFSFDARDVSAFAKRILG